MHHLRYLITGLCIISTIINARSPFREDDPRMPHITTYWADEPTKKYSLKNSHLEKYAIFDIFDKDHFFNHLIPLGPISFRHDQTQSVDGALLIQLIEEVLDELRKSRYQKNNFKHFIVLKNRDYNSRARSGLIVLKFKNYPFVVKLFMETPQSFVRPFSKGIEPSFIFTLGRGTSRHGSGFTRIPNRENIEEKIKNDPYFSQIVDMPRKWYFHSAKCRWFVINGTNIGTTEQLSCMVPGTYGIICDAIEEHPTKTMSKNKYRRQAIHLSHFLNCSIDPHINNFMIEKSSEKIIIIDTEHFPSLVGLDSPFSFSNYPSYYAQLAHKYMKDALFRTKKERYDSQKREPSAFRKLRIRRKQKKLNKAFKKYVATMR